MPGLWCTQRIWYSRLLSQVLRETWLWVNGGCDITRNQNTKIHDARCGNTPFKGSHSVKHRHSVLSCVQEIFRHGEATILMWLSWDLEPIQVGSHVGGTTKARRFSNCDAKLRPRRGKRWKQNASCPGENPIKCNLWIFDDLWWSLMSSLMWDSAGDSKCSWSCGWGGSAAWACGTGNDLRWINWTES